MMLFGVMLYNYRMSGQEKIAEAMRRIRDECHTLTISREVRTVRDLEQIVDAATWAAEKANEEEARLSSLE
jgi:hypothetical protein